MICVILTYKVSPQSRPRNFTRGDASLVSCSGGWEVGCLIGWLTGWLDSRLLGWLAYLFVCLFVCLLVVWLISKFVALLNLRSHQLQNGHAWDGHV